MDTQETELWDRLENEPERAYRAFECFLSLPSAERTVIEAYRAHVGNPEAVKPSDTWSRWSSEFAWRERAVAYDDHLAHMRREAHERGLEEEAERQGVLAERHRNRTNELMTLGYERAMEWLEEVGYQGMRASDVIQIMRVHMDYLKAFDADRQPRAEDDWTEEDDAAIADIIKEIDELESPEESTDEANAEEGDEEQN